MAIPAVGKPFFLNENDALLSLWREFIPMLGVLLVTGVFVLAVEKNSLSVSVLKNPIRSITFGFVVGCIWIGASLLFLVFMDYISFGEKNTVTFIWGWFISVILNAVMQEFLVRGYYSLVQGGFQPAAAVISRPFFFSAMHGSAFEAGIIAVLNV
jgi:hypothetical protein